jgi:hypothetical protein
MAFIFLPALTSKGYSKTCSTIMQLCRCRSFEAVIAIRLRDGWPRNWGSARLQLGPTSSPVQWVPGTLSPGVKWPGLETNHSAPSSAEVKNT